MLNDLTAEDDIESLIRVFFKECTKIDRPDIDGQFLAPECAIGRGFKADGAAASRLPEIDDEAEAAAYVEQGRFGRQTDGKKRCQHTADASASLNVVEPEFVDH